MAFIFNNWRWLSVVGMLFLFGLAVWSYGNNKEGEGYSQGFSKAREIGEERYRELLEAKTRTETELRIEREKLPVVVIRWRDRSGSSVATRAQVDSAFQAGLLAGKDCQEQLYTLAEPAILNIDTTQWTKDSLAVRTTGVVQYFPLSREFFASIQAAPSITRTYLIRTGYLVEHIEREDYALELTLGSPLKNPSMRLGLTGWYQSYGVGLDLQNGFSPVPKVGVRVVW